MLTGDKLVLQNDIGTTDAHVLVVHVTGRTVTMTYTNVHLPRLLFFQGMFEGHDVRWEDTRSRKDAGMEDGVYHLCVDGYTARALGESVFTEADTLPELHKMIQDAVRCHFDENDMPKIIRLHIVQEEVIAA